MLNVIVTTKNIITSLKGMKNNVLVITKQKKVDLM